jgi:hypothetical protein
MRQIREKLISGRNIINVPYLLKTIDDIPVLDCSFHQD